ncbi:hypothetical protein B4U78_012300 [Microbacterium esteraromaticum]|uniref:Uncharacterized protein n=1 Tax=Microbacterium commune TaxID=2762219 RepID=A0ABR8W531_9MICO|nr:MULTISPECIES: hypothetical protein [Microbacterium]MBD8012124.1 hypothetical protein [Microbacterium commune]OIU87234.1 hypothetical protein BFN01_10050 [Microbacterium sp. AR7-10]PYD00091.1 hypothetical protein B4U78_012300 [Microbacterium esteraromaticum]
MVYHERVAWAQLIASVITLTGYIAVLLMQSRGGDISTVDWLPPMLWTIGAGIALSIVISILWGIAAGLRDPQSATASDIRDRDISRLGGRVEHSFLVIAGLGVIALCAAGAELFWIANTMFLGFAVSALVGGIARVTAYRRGLV